MTPRTFRPRPLSPRADAWLASAADALVTGALDLAELTPGLRAFYWQAWLTGRAPLLAELHRTRADRDAYFERWHMPDAELRDHAARERIARAVEHAAERGTLRTEADVLHVILGAAETPEAPTPPSAA